LEISKTKRKEYQPVLVHVLTESLKLLHPLCPHVSEELWHELGTRGTDEFLALQKFPEGKNVEEIPSFLFLKEWIGALRTLRNESRVPLSKVIPVYVELSSAEEKLLKQNLPWVESLSKAKFVFAQASEAPHSIVTLSSFEKGRTISLKVPMSELVNTEEEIQRIQKDLSNLNQYVSGLKSKLSNDSFVSRAPAKVVETEKAKLLEAEEKIKKLDENLKQLESL
jgi:valyl-tRNA synthetase